MYHIGGLRKPDSRVLDVKKTKGILRRLYFGSDEVAENKKLTFDTITCKEQMVRATLNWVLENEPSASDTYLIVLKDEYEKRLNIEKFLKTLDDIDRWKTYRNEVIHGLFNKNVVCLNEKIRDEVDAGMQYARFIDSQVKALKKTDTIRKRMKIQ